MTVYEDDLLASRGVGESAGSDTNKESPTQTGDVHDHLAGRDQSLTIDGHTVSATCVHGDVVYDATLGNTLSVSGYDAATGVVSYSYTLLDNRRWPMRANSLEPRGGGDGPDSQRPTTSW